MLDRLIDTGPVPIVVLTLDGNVVIWNRAAEQMFGWTAEEVLGKPNPINPGEMVALSAELRDAVQRGERRVVETRLVRRDGELLDVVLTAGGLRDSSGEVRFSIGIIHDLTEFRGVQARARVAEERARALLDSVTELAVLFLDAESRILNANRGAELLLGWSIDQLRGMSLGSIIDPDWLVEEARITEALCARRDGSRFWADVVLTPIHSLNGALTGSVVVLRDITRRKSDHERERRRLQQSAAVTAFAQRATRELTEHAVAEAAVEHVAAAMQVDYTELLRPVPGAAQLQATHAFGWGRTSTPGAILRDAPTVYAEALRGEVVVRPLNQHDLEHAPHLHNLGVSWAAVVMLRIDGQPCTLGAFARSAISESDIYPLQAIAAMTEAIAARRVAEQQLAERDRTLRMILDQMPAVIWTVDRDFRFMTTKGAGLKELDSVPDRVVGMSLFDMVETDSPAHRAVLRAFEGQSSSYSGEYRTRAYDNRVEPLRDVHGNIVGAMNLAFDITERRRDDEALSSSREELRRLSPRLNMLQEEERRRIAHELHDELGQRLTALRMETSLLPHKLGKRGTRAASDAIASMIELIDETIVTVRRVATELRPAILDDFGFRAALELELAALQKRSGINYSIRFVPEHLTVDRDMATTLYRIVQESLTNVARHAQASTVRVGVEQHDDWIV
ncbi:MAG TPA: PAS domain S-box protein, partial [Thermoanaerobaculia bacterium]|nr:PAS domain S-box protein [Thermoanaerobaculia bacterium]